MQKLIGLIVHKVRQEPIAVLSCTLASVILIGITIRHFQDEKKSQELVRVLQPDIDSLKSIWSDPNLCSQHISTGDFRRSFDPERRSTDPPVATTTTVAAKMYKPYVLIYLGPSSGPKEFLEFISFNTGQDDEGVFYEENDFGNIVAQKVRTIVLISVEPLEQGTYQKTINGAYGGTETFNRYRYLIGAFDRLSKRLGACYVIEDSPLRPSYQKERGLTNSASMSCSNGLRR
jgi:hypothetical protein